MTEKTIKEVIEEMRNTFGMDVQCKITEFETGNVITSKGWKEHREMIEVIASYNHLLKVKK